MTKNNTANSGLLGFIEKLIRTVPLIYVIFRPLIKFTNFFEEDFHCLKSIFKNKKINIIDIGASDGISALFFIKNLNPSNIFCYEPNKNFYKKLYDLKKKYKIIKTYNYGLGKRINCEDVFYPYINVLGKKVVLYAYSFPSKKELEYQIKEDFLIKPKILKEKLKIKKFQIPKKKIDLIKIDTNGSEIYIIDAILPILKRDKPTLIIENNNINLIHKKINFLNYKKMCVENNTLVKHKNQKNMNIIFKQ